MIFDNHTLQSQRLILREFEISDAEEFYKLNSDEEVIRYTGDSAFDSVESARVFLSNYNEYEKNGYGRWAVIDKESKVYLGWCGLKYHKEGYTDIGFRFHKQYWG